MTDVEPLMFMGLIGAATARNSTAIWYSDGSPKTGVDLMRVPWVRDYIRREYRERDAWRRSHTQQTP